MAKSRRKSNGCRRGSYKRKPMGKGWSTERSEPQGSRPVLRITEPEKGDTAPAGAGDDAPDDARQG